MKQLMAQHWDKSTSTTLSQCCLNVAITCCELLWVMSYYELTKTTDHVSTHHYFHSLWAMNCCCIPTKWMEMKMKWNESGFRPPLCTYRLNWARRTSWGWWDDWDDTVLQTQDSKFEPWRSEAEHATSRSRRLPTILTFTRGWVNGNDGNVHFTVDENYRYPHLTMNGNYGKSHQEVNGNYGNSHLTVKLADFRRIVVFSF